MADDVLVAGTWRSNAEMIVDVARLGWIHEDAAIIDLTYGDGKWWTAWTPPGLFAPLSDDFDFRATPYADEQLDVVVFDPPYVAPGGRSTSTIKDFHARYGMADCPKNPRLLQDELINPGLAECARIVKKRSPRVKHQGVVLVKCANYVTSGALVPGVHETYAYATEKCGLRLVDQLEHVTKPRAQPKNRKRKCAGCGVIVRPFSNGEWHDQDGGECSGGAAHWVRQEHARSNSSTLLVFKRWT